MTHRSPKWIPQASGRIADEIEQAPIARRTYEVWQDSGLRPACAHRLCGPVAAVLERFSEECGRALRVRFAVVDFQGERVVAGNRSEVVT